LSERGDDWMHHLRYSTNHVEQWNNTLRQRIARFVPKTLSFSKIDFYHELVLRLFIIRYNIECVS
jgi:insertion element IS1 protein InsB